MGVEAGGGGEDVGEGVESGEWRMENAECGVRGGDLRFAIGDALIFPAGDDEQAAALVARGDVHLVVGSPTLGEVAHDEAT